MRHYRFIRFLLVASLCIGGLAGCGGEVPTDSSEPTSANQPMPLPSSVEIYEPQIQNRAPATLTIEGPTGELSTLTGEKVGQVFVYQDDMVFRYPEELDNPGPFAIGIRRFLRWGNGVIPFYLEEDHPYRGAILQAIETLNRNTVLWYVPANDPSRDHIVIQYGNGCHSGVGRPFFGDGYQVSLGRGCNRQGIIMHELLHAAGLFHEQSREDRDAYLSIYWDNIIDDKKDQWSKSPWWSKTFGSYNPESVMHYDCMTPPFAIDPTKKTMDSRIEVPFGQRTGLSAGDVAAIRAMYYNVSADRGKPEMTPEPLPTLLYDPRCTYSQVQVPAPEPNPAPCDIWTCR